MTNLDLALAICSGIVLADAVKTLSRAIATFLFVKIFA